ncbi:MAG TPA: hypothetical protein VJ617_16170 [Arthrobacter sp.]|nr:hypothetical protein [Arthrobacter sp.]
MNALTETSAAAETAAAVIPSRRRGTPRHGAGASTARAGFLA